ncbi:MAG: DUF3685 domain-containing protein [Synechococcaceae cyanobacterium]|nr:DUF3685 domain-containing protein [Synechococcaceae cyanobacterium]
MPAAEDRIPPQLLLFADPLEREGLVAWLRRGGEWAPVQRQEDLNGAPALVIWSLSGCPPPEILGEELQRLRERWQPAPVLLLLPAVHGYPREWLLRLPVQGLLERPGAERLRTAVGILLEAGRFVSLDGVEQIDRQDPLPAMGLGRWLLVSGLQQIDAELAICQSLLRRGPAGGLAVLLLQGRRRELEAARALLLWLWGPAWMALGSAEHDSGLRAGPAAAGSWPMGLASPAERPGADRGGSIGSDTTSGGRRGGLQLTLRRRGADGLWEALNERLRQVAAAGPDNRSGQLLALDGLRPERRSELLLALLQQFDHLRQRLLEEDLRGPGLLERWRDRQQELRRQALRQLAGSYVQLPLQGSLRPVAESLIQRASLAYDDPELPDAEPMLAPLVQAQPLVIEGRLLPPDEPEALLYLEMLLANWLVRSAELICAELLVACADWPELRRYLLRPELLATRNLERVRNQLNAQQRWSRWVEHPVRLYESRRTLFRLADGAIDLVAITEPRDQELRSLPWPQQLVTLLLESRDALAPQLRSLLRGAGDLLAMLLTRGIGRAIGLVGRGIVQGMGRGLGRG